MSLRLASNRCPPRQLNIAELIATISAETARIHIAAQDGSLVQELQFRPTNGSIAFHLADGPLLGLGQDGPQFDRRGNLDRMISGQGGYQLHTHGGKVPIQFVIGP